jgi:protein-S-isoprenylcysteine O-methyltransferase Ste14
VLELPAGTLARTGVRPGARLDLPELPPARIGALAAVAGNLGLAALSAFFCAAHIAYARTYGRWLPVLPILVEEALLVGLFLVRRRSRRVSRRLGDWGLALGSTYLPLLLRATGKTSAFAAFGLALQTTGLGVSVLALCALGRSLGIVAADRGVRTAGLYRGVRHPLYAGEILSYLGYVMAYPSLANVLVALATTLALARRAGAEERFLAHSPAYRAYCAQVRWRFLPRVY